MGVMHYSVLFLYVAIYGAINVGQAVNRRQVHMPTKKMNNTILLNRLLGFSITLETSAKLQVSLTG